MQKVVSDRGVEICVDTRIEIDVKRAGIVVLNRRRTLAVLIEIGTASQKQLQTMQVIKARKYDLLAGKNNQMYTSKSIPYVMT